MMSENLLEVKDEEPVLGVAPASFPTDDAHKMDGRAYATPRMFFGCVSKETGYCRDCAQRYQNKRDNCIAGGTCSC